MNDKKSEEIRLDVGETNDLWELYHKIPYMTISRNAFISMVLHCPMKITFGNMEMSEELKILFQLYYIQWNIDTYDWLQCFGVCPWYVENVKGTPHRIPVVPPFGSGYITTFLDNKFHQQFVWYNNDGSTRKMYFETKSHPPGLNGRYYSPISSILTEWRTSKIIREATEIAVYRQARTQHIFEYHPGKNSASDDTNITQLEQFGDSISSTVLARQERLDSVKVNIRTDDFQNSLMMASAYNRGIKQKFGSNSAFLNTDTNNQKWEIENANVIDNAILLKPDFQYKSVTPPNVHANMIEICNRLDRMASALMDIPVGVIESSAGKTTAGIQGNFRILNERIKDWQNYFKQSTKKAFLIMHGEFLLNELEGRVRLLRRETPEKMLELYIDSTVVVEMACTPIANIADIQNIFELGFISKEKAAEHIFNVLGLPISDISHKQE